MAKRKMRGSISSGKGPSRFLLFESIVDKNWAQRDFVEYWAKEDGFKVERMRGVRWAFVRGKRDAVRHHREALKAGYTISTLVDMDHDIPGKDLKNAKQIHTTSPACTLWTIQFVDQKGSLSEVRLNEFIKSQCSFEDEAKISEIAENAASLTMKRLQNSNPYSEKKFRKKGWLKPINDHDLCDAIANGDVDKMNSVGEAMRASAIKDETGLVRNLFRKMFNGIFADDGPHSRT